MFRTTYRLVIITRFYAGKVISAYMSIAAKIQWQYLATSQGDFCLIFLLQALESGEGGAVVATRKTPGRVYRYSVQDQTAP